MSLWDCIAILICSIPAFYLLGTPSIYIWDEAVYANASLDMSEGHSWWVPLQDTYNTKPPLVLWLQAISLKIFPWPEFAVRFPSALSVTGILLLLAIALKRWGFSQWTRIFVLVCFVGNEGFVRHHISRTGDLDAVMTFFIVGYSLVVLDAIHFQRWNRKYLVLLFVMVICAFYAKSIAGWMMLGPLGIVWLLSPLRKIVWTKQFIAGAILAGACCLFYYLSREIIQPRFISLAWHSEYLRMFSNVMPWHAHGFSYYFKNFISQNTYAPWMYFLLASMAYSLFILKDKIYKEHLLRWMLISLGYMILISIPADKLEWYDAPVFPFFALILGTVAGQLANRIPSRWRILFLLPVLFILWRKINFIRHDIQPRHAFEIEGAILRQMSDVDSIKVYMPVETAEHRLQLDFYRKIKKKETRKDVEVLETIDQVSIYDHLIVSDENLNKLKDGFVIEVVKEMKDKGSVIRITGKK